MACDVSKGKISLQCKDAVSGIKAIYVANYNEYGFQTSSTESGHELLDLGTLTDVFKYTLKNSANTYEQTINSSRDNGTTFYTQVINFTLTKMSSEMEFQLKMMALGRPIIFVEGNNGSIVLIGKDNGCEVAGKGTIGGTFDSLNGYQLTGTANEQEPAWFLQEDVITQLKALVSTDNIAG